MSASKKIKGAGLTGAGMVGGLAGWATVNRFAARHFQRVTDDVLPEFLDMPDDLTTRIVTVSDGWKVRVIERGPEDGQPVVLLHGITLSAEIWPYQMADLPTAGFRVIAFDLRGHGGSARDDRPSGLEPSVGAAPAEGVVAPESAEHADRMTITRLARDVEEVMAQLDLQRVILVGHSMGGMVALRMMARDRPTRNGRGRVAAMALVASSANATRRRGLPGISEVVTLARPLIARGAGLAAHLPGPTLPANDLAFLLARVTFGIGSSARQVLWTGEMASHVPVGVSGELLLNIIRFNEEAHLPSIHMPTTVIVGDHDLMTPLGQSEYLAKQIPGAELINLAGCGHMVMLERPKELDEAIIALAERATPGPAAAQRAGW